MNKKNDGRLALAMLIGAVGGEIPKANKGFNGNDNLKKGKKMSIEDLEKNAREILKNEQKKY